MFFRTEVVLFLALIASSVKGVHVGDGTYYIPALGACGKHNNEADFIVSMAHGTFDNFPGATSGNPNKNPICNRRISISYRGKTATATIVDRCGGCNGANDVDLSPAVFKKFANLGVGRLHGVEWKYI